MSATTLAVAELDEGESSDATFCFETIVNLTRRMDARFDLLISNSTTANITSDFSSNLSTLAISSGFEGFYNACTTLTILGDDVVEDDELIELEVRPQSERDTVLFSELTIVIIDNDGMYNKNTT